MNIGQSVALSNLRIRKEATKRETVSRIQVARQVFARALEGGRPYQDVTAKQWAQDWLSSEKFVLLDIPLNSVAIPNQPSNPAHVLSLAASNDESPIVVDLNRKHVGKTSTNYFPPVIVVDGKHRHKSRTINGHQTIKAWVGIKAAAKLGFIHADHKLGSDELRTMLSQAISKKYGKQIKLPGGAVTNQSPWVREVYPFENYCIFANDSKEFRQAYSINQEQRKVILLAEPVRVRQVYEDVAASAMNMARTATLYGNGGGGNVTGIIRPAKSRSTHVKPVKANQTLVKAKNGKERHVKPVKAIKASIEKKKK